MDVGEYVAVRHADVARFAGADSGRYALVHSGGVEFVAYVEVGFHGGGRG